MTGKSRFIPFSVQPEYYEGLGSVSFEPENSALNLALADRVSSLPGKTLGKAFLRQADLHLATASMLVSQGIKIREAGHIPWSQTTLYYGSLHAARGLASLCGNILFFDARESKEKILTLNAVPRKKKMYPKGSLIGPGGMGHKATWNLLEKLLRDEPPANDGWFQEAQPDPDFESHWRNQTSYSPSMFVALSSEARQQNNHAHHGFHRHDYTAHQENNNVERKAMARLILLANQRAGIDVEFIGVPDQDADDGSPLHVFDLEKYYARMGCDHDGLFKYGEHEPSWLPS
jgi:hypothetical protein